LVEVQNILVRTYRLETETLVPAPLDEVFEFFSRAENLEAITPEFLRFKILTPLPIEMKPGALIEYRLRLFGLPVRWVTKITVWEPGVRFVDVQLKGPYAKWEHEHRFAAEGGQTRMGDTVEYALPGGPLGPLVHALFVRKRVESIFSHRGDVIRRRFGEV